MQEAPVRREDKGVAQCRRFRLWAVLLSLPIVLVLVLLLLFFGDPQWNKYIFIFQCHVIGDGQDVGFRPPPGYTGKWTYWYANGNKWIEANYKNGVEHGKYIYWREDGVRLEEATYAEGKYDGTVKRWDFNGNLICSERYENGKLVKKDM